MAETDFDPELLAQLEDIDPELLAQLQDIDVGADPTLLERGVSKYNIAAELSPERLEELGELTDISAALEGRVTQPSAEMEALGLGGVEQALTGAGERLSQAALNMTTMDPMEVADILTNRFPEDVDVVLSPEGVPVVRNKHKFAEIQGQLDAGDITPEQAEELRTDAQWAINKPGFSGMDALQAIGLMGAYTPAGRVAAAPLRAIPEAIKGEARRAALKTASRGAAGRAVALEGTTEYAMQKAQEAAGGRLDPDEIAFTAVTAAVPEYVLTPAVTGMRKTYNIIKDKVVIPDGIQKAIDFARRTGRKIATSDVLMETIKAPRLIFLKSADRIPLVGTSGMKLRQARERTDSLKSMFNHFGLVGDTPYSQYIAQSFSNQSRRSMAGINSLRTEAFDTLRDTGNVNPRSFMNIIDDELEAAGKLERDQRGNLLNWLNSTRQDFEGIVDGSMQFNFKDADIFLNSMVEGAGGKDLKSQMKKRLAKALVKDMKRHGTKADVKGWQKWDLARNLGLKEMKKIEDKALKTAVREGKIESSLVDRLLETGRNKELDVLWKRTDATGHDLIRKRVFSEAIKKTGANPGDLATVNMASLVNVLDKDPATLRAMDKFWSPEDREVIEGFKEYLRHTEKSSKAFEATGMLAGGQAAGGGKRMLMGMIAAVFPPTLAIVSAARTHESDMIRDLLLRLHHADVSPIEERIVLADLRELILTAGKQAMDSGRDPFAAEAEPTMVEKLLKGTGQIGEQLMGAITGFKMPGTYSAEESMEQLRAITGQE